MFLLYLCPTLILRIKNLLHLKSPSRIFVSEQILYQYFKDAIFEGPIRSFQNGKKYTNTFHFQASKVPIVFVLLTTLQFLVWKLRKSRFEHWVTMQKSSKFCLNYMFKNVFILRTAVKSSTLLNSRSINTIFS